MQEGSKQLSIKYIQRAPVGSPNWAVLLRRELVATHSKHGVVINDLEAKDRRLVADIAQVAAEQDGLRIVLRLGHTALEAAVKVTAARDKKFGRISDDIEDIRSLLWRHENPNHPTSSWAYPARSVTSCMR